MNIINRKLCRSLDKNVQCLRLKDKMKGLLIDRETIQATYYRSDGLIFEQQAKT
ncbi:10993_t:CDS:1, partial [Cetraspora pellucida]